MLFKIRAAEGLAVPLEVVKRRLLIDDDVTEDDDDIERLVLAATTMVEQHTGRVMLPTEFEQRFDGWCNSLRLTTVPVREVTDVLYLDANHAEQSLPAADWYFEPDDRGATVYFVEHFSAPGLSNRAAPVRVRFEAGFDAPDQQGENPELLPDPRDDLMISMLVANWYANRESATDKALSSAPDGFWALAAQRRIYA